MTASTRDSITAMISPTIVELSSTVMALNTLLQYERQQSAASQAQHEATIEQIRAEHAGEIRTMEARVSVAEARLQAAHDQIEALRPRLSVAIWPSQADEQQDAAG